MKNHSLSSFSILLLLLVLVFSCDLKKESVITVQLNDSSIDTLKIKNIVTDEVVAIIPTNVVLLEAKLDISEPLYAAIGSDQSENSYLSIIIPGHDKLIIIDSTSIRTNSLADSLERYFTKSLNFLLARHGNLIFSGKGEDEVLSIFDSLIQTRSRVIEGYKNRLTNIEYEILNYHNRAKTYSFLFFYGRYIRSLNAKDSFFSFINTIDNSNTYAKTQPNNLLYKFEIEYLRINDSIQSTGSFVSFIEEQTANDDLIDFLKIIYLKEIIESPDYWQKHQQIFIADDIKEALNKEGSNPYKYLLDKILSSYYSSRKGELAYDFEAILQDSTIVRLSDYKGKLVLIDVWATWCGPCIEHRPDFLEIAKKYKDDERIQVLMLSVDKSLNKWKNYSAKSNPESFGEEINIRDGLNKVLRDKYFVTGIPTYILIDDKGFIIDANLPEPSIKMERIIEEALKNK